MNKSNKKYYLLLIAVFFNSMLLAQYPNIRFKHLDIEQGLSQNIVKKIIQDKIGFIWIATWDGLNRYDGYNFHVYKHIDGDTTSLIVNKIASVLEDNEGRLWVGTFGGGLSLFNRKNESFTNFVHDPSNPNSISNDQIQCIYQDSRNRIWIGTRNGGLSLIEKINLAENVEIQFKNFSHDPSNYKSLSSSGVQTILEDKYHNLWIATSDGSLNKLVEKNNSYEFIQFKPSSEYTNLLFDDVVEDNLHPGLIWLSDYYKGIFWFDSKAGKFLSRYPYSNISDKIPLGSVISMNIDASGQYWFGTYADGIYSYKPNSIDKNDYQFDHIDFDPSGPFGISSPNITEIFEDKSGLIWVGTNTNGVYINNTNSEKFIGFEHNSFDNNSLVNDNVLGVLEDHLGNVWIATELGLDKYDISTKKFTHYNSSTSNIKLSSDVVYALYEDKNGILWIGTETGLDKFDVAANSIYHYKHNPNDSNSISHGEVIKIFSDSKGSLWLGCWNGGLNKLIQDLKDNSTKFLHYKFDKTDPNSISDNRIMSIAEGPDQRLWIGTADGGLNQLVSDYSFKNGIMIKPKFISYKHISKDGNSLSSNDVRTIFIDKKGTLWLGTFGGGLNKFDPPKNQGNEVRFYHYRQTQGLANDVVRGIIQDDDGFLWLATSNGLSKFNPKNEVFLNFDLSDGLQTVKFEDVYYKSKQDSKLYFGGVGGLVAFNPSEIDINRYRPAIIISSFQRYNLDLGKMVVETGISESKEIVLSYKDNILSFEFSALNYLNSFRNNYSYKLEGYNDNWIELGNKRDVTFTNLDPGEYTLYVRGSNNNGIWNKDGTALKIIITPPWWQTKFAFVAYGVLFLLTIFIIDRIMRRRVISQERNKAQLREAELIKKQANELETVDRLVKVINSAADLDNLFNSLLSQTMSILPQAEMAAIFLLDKRDDLFKPTFTAGYKIDDIGNLSFTYHELKKRYSTGSEEVEKGIYILNNTEKLFGDDKLAALQKPKSMLVMEVERESVSEAFVVFDSFSDQHPFSSSDARVLNRFREHAVSAISKAQAIKELQEKNEEIIRTQEQLVTQQKLASLGTLTAGIAHEIKNPLNFVNNFSEISNELIDEMKIELQNDNKAEALEIANDIKLNLEKINQHGKRADSIVRGMLLHSRGNSGEKVLTNINDLLDQYVNLAYHGLRAQDKDFNITIEKDYDSSMEKINVVPQDLSRVFLNVINNGFYAANDKKRKTGSSFSPVLKLATKNFQNKIEIRIRDNGNGIPEFVRDSIFNPFFTTKPAGEGTGLGLSISYDIIVKEHSGDFRFESKDGEYTEFIITIPKQ